MSARREIQWRSDSPDDTLALGRAIGQRAAPGDVIALVGPLGAGKTLLVKGIALGLRVPPSEVHSPTFVLVNEYTGRLILYHLDAYRLKGPAELSALGFEELCSEGAVVVVEWADRAADLIPDHALWIAITPDGKQSRKLAFTGQPDVLMRLVESRA